MHPQRHFWQHIYKLDARAICFLRGQEPNENDHIFIMKAYLVQMHQIYLKTVKIHPIENTNYSLTVQNLAHLVRITKVKIENLL